MRKRRQPPTEQEINAMCQAIYAIVNMAPSYESAVGVTMGAVNTIFQIWGKDEAMRAANGMEVFLATYKTQREKGNYSNPMDSLEPGDATTILATEGLLTMSRN